MNTKDFSDPVWKDNKNSNQGIAHLKDKSNVRVMSFDKWKLEAEWCLIYRVNRAITPLTDRADAMAHFEAWLKVIQYEVMLAISNMEIRAEVLKMEDRASQARSLPACLTNDHGADWAVLP